MNALKSVKDTLNQKAFCKKCLKGLCLCITLAAVIFLVCGAVRFAVLQSYRNQDLHLSTNFTVTAHTGAMDTPDNSVASIEKAIAVGADVVEFDVRFRPNGTPVMAHDAVGSDGEGVPIAEALEVLSKDGVNIKVNLDIKETTNLSALQALVEQYGLLDRVFCTGVTEAFVPEVQTQCPEIPYYLNYAPDKNKLKNSDYQAELIHLLEKTGAAGVNCHYKNADKHLADVLHAHNYLLSVWTVDKEPEMVRLLVSGADNITSGNPDLLIELIANWKA